MPTTGSTPPSPDGDLGRALGLLVLVAHLLVGHSEPRELAHDLDRHIDHGEDELAETHEINVTPFIATLGMNFIVFGAALLYSGGAPRGDIPPNMRFWGNGFIADVIPAAAIVLLIVALITWFLLSRTTFGRRLTAIGANRRAAYLSGVGVRGVTLLAYGFSGLLASAGGLLLVAFVGVGTLEVGTDFLLGSIAAAVIGGTPFEGGKGTVGGTIAGVLFLMVLYSVLTALALPVSGRRIAEGLIILVAVALYARSRT